MQDHPRAAVLTFRRLGVGTRNTAYTEENIEEAFESAGMNPCNPRSVQGKRGQQIS